MLVSIVSYYLNLLVLDIMCLSSLFRELWPFENSKMYGNVLKIQFKNGQNSLENLSMTLKFAWQMLL